MKWNAGLQHMSTVRSLMLPVGCILLGVPLMACQQRARAAGCATLRLTGTAASTHSQRSVELYIVPVIAMLLDGTHLAHPGNLGIDSICDIVLTRTSTQSADSYACIYSAGASRPVPSHPYSH